MHNFAIDKLWHGQAIAPEQIATLSLEIADAVVIRIAAPLTRDVPDLPPGRVTKLCEFDVVELFLLGANQAYLELEFGPAGHYWALELKGERNVVRDDLIVDYQTEVRDERFYGVARLSPALLPPGCAYFNAYRIARTGKERIYYAACPLAGDAPDFHQLSAFSPLDCGV